QAELTEVGALPQGRQQHGALRGELLADLDAAEDDEIEAAGALSLADDGLSGLDPHGDELRQQALAALRGHGAKKRRRRQEVADHALAEVAIEDRLHLGIAVDQPPQQLARDLEEADDAV